MLMQWFQCSNDYSPVQQMKVRKKRMLIGCFHIHNFYRFYQWIKRSHIIAWMLLSFRPSLRIWFLPQVFLSLLFFSSLLFSLWHLLSVRQIYLRIFRLLFDTRFFLLLFDARIFLFLFFGFFFYFSTHGFFFYFSTHGFFFHISTQGFFFYIPLHIFFYLCFALCWGAMFLLFASSLSSFFVFFSFPRLCSPPPVFERSFFSCIYCWYLSFNF